MVTNMGIRGHRSSRLYYQKKDHTDPVFNFGGSRFHEKMYMESDECDGMIWEKVHDNEIAICCAKWYAGGYGNISSWTALLHPKEPYMSLMYNMGEPGNFGYLTRTKDFGLRCYTGAYDNPWGGFYASKDGLEWVNYQYLPSGHLLYSGWSVDENIGICYGPDTASGKRGFHRLELDDSGKLTTEYLGEGASISTGDQGFCGPIATWQGVFQDGVHYWLKFMDAEGSLYISNLPASYEWIDDMYGEINRAAYNWTFYYLNGKYYAFEKARLRERYYNSVLGEWQMLYDTLVVESSDGFKTVNMHYIARNRVEGWFQGSVLLYYNEHLMIFEYGYTADPQTRQPIYHNRVWDFGDSFGNTPTVKDTVPSITMPVRGMGSDPNCELLTAWFYGDEPPSGGKSEVRSVGRPWSGTFDNIYFKDGAITYPHDYIIFPTTFMWSYGTAWDRAGFMVIEGDLTRQPKDAFAIDSNNYMLDKYNATWGVDKYYVVIDGQPNDTGRVTEVNRSYEKYTHTFQLDVKGLCTKYFRFHTSNKIISATVNGVTKQRTLRHVETRFDFRDRQFITSSPYYKADTGVFTTILQTPTFGREYSKEYSGRAYCFAIYINGYTSPMIIAEDEFPSYYNANGGSVPNLKCVPILYDDKFWYCSEPTYGFGGNHPDSERYIDASEISGQTIYTIAVYCLKKIYES